MTKLEKWKADWLPAIEKSGGGGARGKRVLLYKDRMRYGLVMEMVCILTINVGVVLH